MLIVGLTGSIGMGKTTTAAMFRAAGVPVHDADATVHRLYAGRAVAAVEQRFLGVSRDGRVDRDLLRQRVLGQPEAFAALEGVIHPMVREEEASFLEQARQRSNPLAVLDIPLLLETAGEGRVDVVVVVSAAPAVQLKRVLARPGMTRERFAQIAARQLPDPEKRRRAHYVIDTNTIPGAQAGALGLLRTLAFSI